MTARKYGPVCSFPGCGRKHNARGLCGPHGTVQRKGQPLRPLLNRSGPVAKSELERFTAKTAAAPSGCIIWTGARTAGGYGVFAEVTTRGGEKREMAHRWSYRHHVGPIPEGYDVDHLCRVRACVNPEHLEAVTRAENIRRAAAVKTECPAGHAYDDANTYIRPGYGHRKCRTCSHKRDLARADVKNARRRAARALRKAA